MEAADAYACLLEQDMEFGQFFYRHVKHDQSYKEGNEVWGAASGLHDEDDEHADGDHGHGFNNRPYNLLRANSPHGIAEKLSGQPPKTRHFSFF